MKIKFMFLFTLSLLPLFVQAQNKPEIVIDGKGKAATQDSMVAEILLDADIYSGKFIELKNFSYEAFYFHKENHPFLDANAWFRSPDTVYLNDGFFMYPNHFKFYFRPRPEDREARKFILQKMDDLAPPLADIKSMIGYFVKFKPYATTEQYFFITSLEYEGKTYLGTLPPSLYK